MYYVYVKDGQISSNPQPLPTHWNNIANFYLLDSDKLLSYGWYPYRLVQEALQENEIHTEISFSIEGNEVIGYQTKRPKTNEEIDYELFLFWENIRSKRNYLLTESDWTQLADSPLTEEKKAEWITYRQSLRDITLQTDLNAIVWPTKPE